MPVTTILPKPVRRKVTPAKTQSFLEFLDPFSSNLEPPKEVIPLPGEPARKAADTIEKAPGEALEKVPGVKAVKEAEVAAVSTAHFLGELSELKTWVRIGKVLLGGILILLGLWMLLKAMTNPAAALSTVTKNTSRLRRNQRRTQRRTSTPGKSTTATAAAAAGSAAKAAPGGSILDIMDVAAI